MAQIVGANYTEITSSLRKFQTQQGLMEEKIEQLRALLKKHPDWKGKQREQAEAALAHAIKQNATIGEDIHQLKTYGGTSAATIQDNEIKGANLIGRLYSELS